MQFIESVGENTVIRLNGKLDYAVAGTLMTELKSLVGGQKIKRIDIYCEKLEYISSAGIRAMVFLRQKIDKDVEVDVYMHNMAQAVKDVFALSGLQDYFEFID